jgi:hypothetical protein
MAWSGRARSAVPGWRLLPVQAKGISDKDQVIKPVAFMGEQAASGRQIGCTETGGMHLGSRRETV